MTTEQAKQLDIVVYLERHDIRPVKVTVNQYWYYSRFRNEHTPSFKVNRLFNLWYDFGEGKRSTLIDLGIRLESCTVKDFLVTLNDCHVGGKISFSFRLPYRKANNNRRKPTIKILSTHIISSPRLFQYLYSRKINVDIADKYLQEVRYQMETKFIMPWALKMPWVATNYVASFSRVPAHLKVSHLLIITLLDYLSLKAALTSFLTYVLLDNIKAKAF